MTGLLMKGSSEKSHAPVFFHSMGLSQSKNSPLDITQKSVTALPTTKAFRSTKTSHLLKILTYVGCFFGSIPNTKFLEKGHTRCRRALLHAGIGGIADQGIHKGNERGVLGELGLQLHQNCSWHHEVTWFRARGSSPRNEPVKPGEWVRILSSSMVHCDVYHHIVIFPGVESANIRTASRFEGENCVQHKPYRVQGGAHSWLITNITGCGNYNYTGLNINQQTGPPRGHKTH